jgi:hypothetical protein
MIAGTQAVTPNARMRIIIGVAGLIGTTLLGTSWNALPSSSSNRPEGASCNSMTLGRFRGMCATEDSEAVRPLGDPEVANILSVAHPSRLRTEPDRSGVLRTPENDRRGSVSIQIGQPDVGRRVFQGVPQ